MKVELIVIHCSDSAWGDVEEIDDWHRQRGFQRQHRWAKDSHLQYVGYHYVIENGHRGALSDYDELRDGLVTLGRVAGEEPGAHAYGVNSKSIGICLIGKKTFTDAQMNSLHGACQALLTQYGLDPSAIIGHRDTPHEVAKESSRKTCPNFDVKEWRDKQLWIS